MLEGMRLKEPFEKLPNNIAEFYGQKIELHDEMTLIDPNSRIRRRDTAEVAGNSGAGTLDRLALAALPFARHQAVAR